MDILTNEEAELFHHGIKGQRWGIRRYQNADGSLTPDGKKRYMKDARFRAKWEKVKAKDEAKKKAVEEAEARKHESAEQRHARLMKSNNANELMKHIDELSTEEIRERVNRIQAERSLAQYMTKNPTKIEKAMQKVEAVNAYANRAMTVINSPAGKMATSYIKKQLGIDTTPVTNYKRFLRDVDRKSDKQIQEMQKRIQNEENIRKALARIEAMQNPQNQNTNSQPASQNQNQNQNQNQSTSRNRRRNVRRTTGNFSFRRN